ncbi:mechanosensitive ion channel protein 9-like isoform X2 [Chenopodium quinoa]|uniref:mechanosensitive ion channel protein 9-like isoform X2 n=1 Tax=Chenopodium quinoa TaxID=63459 RepID=UPI000B78A0A2|nr:mechanosensitive ion channel protein 9-like isoform X2 [Chenopodium quinoa]
MRRNAESLKRSPLQPNDGKNEENNPKSHLPSFINVLPTGALNSNFKGFYKSAFYSKSVAEIFSNVDLFNNLMRVCDRRKSVGDEVDEWEKQGMNGLHDKDVKRGDEAAAYVYVKKLSKEVKKTAKADLLMQDDRTPTLHGIQLVAQYLLTAKNALSNDNYTSDILLDLQKRSQDGIINKDIMKQIIESNTQQSSRALENESVKDEFDYFKGQLHDDTIDLSEELSLNIIKAWMDRACSNCLVLANTLSSVKEVVDGLDKIISFLLIVATFIMWLLLTGLASTKILVTASPFLAATFIFGESCKTLFHGIMYIFVVHPFDVGDLCIIDQKMMEVRTIGFWKATFTIVGTQEEVMFTNSQLSNKDIVNHRSNFDWNDCIELDTTSLTKQKITKLKQKIAEHLEDDTEKKFTAGYNFIAVLTTEDKIKLAINFKHSVDCKSSIYSECLKTKQELRSELILHIHDLLEQIKNEKPETSENSTEQAQENKELGNSS